MQADMVGESCEVRGGCGVSKREQDGWMAEPGPAEKRINESLKVE